MYVDLAPHPVIVWCHLGQIPIVLYTLFDSRNISYFIYINIAVIKSTCMITCYVESKQLS